ncbi:MAG: stage II sporulation protein M [Paludibacter sp.]|nr:stage II sporulation protein M [Paludibacter sp.]
MREVAFIKQNKAKWIEFEQSLGSKEKQNPDEMAEMYIQLLNDLSYSQTYYPKSKTTDYLNFLVSQIYRKIYKTKRIERNKLYTFFFKEVPELIYFYRRKLTFAFILFFFFTFIGAVSAAYDDTFVRIILGDNYVDMTLKNIDQGTPMAVYTSQNQLISFIGITSNNILVAVRAYIYGISAGILTFLIAMQNGIMLGSFQYFFYEYHVFAESLRTIWLHGAMEIFSIVISTMAGFILGSSLLFPGTYSHGYSLMRGARHSLKIMISLIPFFIMAGFIEGFVTRLSSSMPLWLNLLIIFGTLCLISFYYMVLPFINNKKNKYDRFSTIQEA